MMKVGLDRFVGVVSISAFELEKSCWAATQYIAGQLLYCMPETGFTIEILLSIRPSEESWPF